MALGKRKGQDYITIPKQGTKPEWVKGVSTEELFAAHGKNLGSLGTVEISYRLETLAEELSDQISQSPVRVLVTGFGEEAKKVLIACKDAGIDAFATYAGDVSNAAYANIAHDAICLDTTFSTAVFTNGHALLDACASHDIHIILDISSDARDQVSYCDLAASKGVRVFRPTSPATLAAGWVSCGGKALTSEISWRKCSGCGLLFDRTSLAAGHFVCPSCKTYFRMSSAERIRDLLDDGSFVEWERGTFEANPLEFEGYTEKLKAQRDKTGLDEAVRCGVASLAGIRFAIAIMDAGFFMGSLGSAVGEKITRTVERATEEALPLVIFTASGGARMQEGLVSLMQMAKVSCALASHADAGLLYVSVITDPTTGGVTASYAMQGDIILAEPNALIGFAGARVIKDTIKQELPEGFQTAEFALEHGLIDAVIPRDKLRETLAHILAIHESSSARCALSDGTPITYAAILENLVDESGTYNEIAYGVLPHIRKTVNTASKRFFPNSSKTARRALLGLTKKEKAERRRLAKLLRGDVQFQDGARITQPSSDLSVCDTPTDAASAAWQAVQCARNSKRPTARFYLAAMIDGFIEVHGDRSFADDGAIITGIGWFGTQPVTVIAQEKGADLEERLKRNFGCAQPEGYRKAMRAMKQAEKFGRPIVCLVDTQGAFCDIGAEERGQGNAIAECLTMMAGLQVPVVSVIVGEGGSGGALALALGNRVAMQENAVYSILSPEGFASILWKDKTLAPDAAAVMKMTAHDALELGVVDAVLSEGDGPAHENPDISAACVRGYIAEALSELASLASSELIRDRYWRFRKF